MGYTSSEVKNRWNKQHYDTLNFRFPLGSRNEIRAAAKAHGLSMNAFVRQAILQAMTEDERRQSPVLSGRKPEETENGYVSPFPPPPRRLIDRFFEGVRA